jgi:hypothetical protein
MSNILLNKHHTLPTLSTALHHTHTHTHKYTHTHTYIKIQRIIEGTPSTQANGFSVVATTKEGPQVARPLVHTLTYADLYWRMLAYADVCWRLLVYADGSERRGCGVGF